LLDEPTNHLDMRAKDVLLESLSGYSGTVVFVSHDRYFIDNLATRVFEIEEGHVHVFPGNYEDYLWRKQGGPEALAATQTVETVPATPTAPSESKKRVNPMKVQKLRDRLAEVEHRVAQLESEIAQQEAALADYKSAEESRRLTEAMDTRRSELETRVKEWESLSAELDSGA
jgi:ATP-binding cassette subfamily F protein 3